MLFEVIVFSLISGCTVFLGALLSYYFEKTKLKNKKLINHFLIAFGTGIMLAAICFILVPHGMKNYNVFLSSVLFFSGAISFYLFDKYILKKRKNTPMIFSMLLDFIPESLALGVMFVYNHKLGILLAIFIALQNLPESFNSYLELRKNSFSIKKSLIIHFLLSFVGLTFSLIAFYFLKEQMFFIDGIMLFASGGILYLIFQDIAPSLVLKNNKSIALGVNLGFVIGILGQAI